MWLPIPAAALVQRELLEGLRQKKVFLLLLTSNVLVLAVFGLGLIEVAENPSGMARATSSAFKALCTMWYALAVLFIPAMAGTSICIEKQQGSFDLLWTTLVRPSGVIAAKMINILSIFLLIVLSNLPVVGVMFFFVGVDWSEFLIGFGLVFLTAVACAAAGLMASAFFYRTLAAFAASYAATLCFLGLPLVVFKMLGILLGSDPFLNEMHAACIPPFTLGIVLTSTVPQRGILYGGIAYQILSIVFMLFLASGCLNRPPRPMRVDTRKVIDDTDVLRARRHRFPYYLVDPQRRRAAIADGSNPMCAKEIYSGVLARPTWRIRTFYTSLILAFPFGLLGTVLFDYDVDRVLLGVCWYLAAILVVLAPGVMAQALPKEYELGNMDLLRTTLLTPRQILVGKLLGATLMLVPFLLGALCGLSLMLVCMAWKDPVGFLSAAAEGGVLISVNIAWALVLSLWASLYFRRTLPALVAAYITGLFFIAGLPPILFVVWEFTGRIGQYFGSPLALVRSTFYFMSPMSSPIMRLEHPGSREWWFWALNMATFAALSVVLMGASIRRFKHTHERDR